MRRSQDWWYWYWFYRETQEPTYVVLLETGVHFPPGINGRVLELVSRTICIERGFLSFKEKRNTGLRISFFSLVINDNCFFFHQALLFEKLKIQVTP